MSGGSFRTVQPDQIPETEFSEEFLCTASGPGGQNVNRTANTVRLLFFAKNSSLLDEGARMRFYKAHAPDQAGCVAIVCRESRSLQQNRLRAKEILAQWITEALKRPLRRKKTKPTAASRERRLKGKSLRSQVKRLRSNASCSE